MEKSQGWRPMGRAGTVRGHKEASGLGAEGVGRKARWAGVAVLPGALSGRQWTGVGLRLCLEGGVMSL